MAEVSWPHNFSWGAALLVPLNLLVGGALVAFIRTRPTLAKIKNEREATLLEVMQERIDKLEKQIDEERAKRDEAEKIHAAERAIDRHRINNVTQCFDALLLMIEAAPDKASESVARIKAMRAKQMETEAIEKSNIHAAKIVGASGGMV